MTYESHLIELPEDAPWNEKPGESIVRQGDTDQIPEVDVTEQDLAETGENPENWLIMGGSYQSQRHTTADVITPENVGDLETEYRLEVADHPNDFQGSPILVDGDPPIMYVTVGPDLLYAINARSGEILWRHFYRPLVGASDTTPPAERGAAVLGDTVYKSTLDLGVIAIDRYTGEEQWYYNGAAAYRGEVADDLMHEELKWERSRGTTSSFPPLIYNGMLMKGSFGGEFGVSGFFDGISLEDGSPQWRVNMTPPHEWVGESWQHGGATAWASGALEPDSGSVVIPSANPGPWYGTVRPGWNPYSCGKVAVNAEDGEYQWHHQDSPHDWWDYDSPSPPVVFEAEVDGETKNFATWPGKTGWVYTVDMETGQLEQRSDEFVQHLNTFNLPPYDDLDSAPWIMPDLIGGTNPQPSAYDPETQTLVVKGTNYPIKFSWFETEYQPGEIYIGMDTVRRTEPVNVEEEEEQVTGEEVEEGEQREGDEVGNETAGNETAMGNETIGNETVGNETAGNETAGNETDGGDLHEEAGDEGEEEEEEEEEEGTQFADEPVEEWNQNAGVIAGIDPLTGEVKWQNWFSWRVGPPWGGSLTTATGVTLAGGPGGYLHAFDTESGERLSTNVVGNHGVDGAPISWYDPNEGKQYVAITGGGGNQVEEEGNTIAVYSLQE
ncbi:PQQ-binding-like beta-propeller repeat protein [Natrinema sp. 1APR25-10V2]|uniref:outer membrane protein assembly factor BamB family protein n=1 Tax=Natrinema sp. 1APR25-10V2 TaxID=2951081 RepID=UPI002875AC5C|nr:PQQ-binding-like beta-propeller repeat protein [Natrinema sp. 1APR25-10V2]MDS0474757.1 PQQ-binding-like beta-propeller repeat protein [Natrinema sp. 1APR25-10V2]